MVESANLEAVFLEVCHFASTTVWRGVILPGTEKCHGHSTRQGHRGAPGQGVDIRMKDVTVRGQSIRSGLLGPGKMEKCEKADAIVVSILWGKRLNLQDHGRRTVGPGR